MSFNDSPSHPFIALDKMPAMNRVANSAIYWHSILEQKNEMVKKAELAITNFLMMDLKDEMTRFIELQKTAPEELQKLLKKRDDDKDHPIIYPYAPENQFKFTQSITELEFVANSIPVILNVQKEMNALPKRMEQQQQQKQQQAGNNIFIGQKESWLKNTFKKTEKNLDNVTDITAYSRSTDLIDRLMQAPVIVTRYNAYHWERVTDCLKFFRGKREPQLNLLSIEIVHYHSVVKPMINSILNEMMRLNLMDENAGIFSMLGRGQESHERRDMMPTFGPPE